MTTNKILPIDRHMAVCLWWLMFYKLISLFKRTLLIVLTGIFSGSAAAQLVCFEGFGQYNADSRVESGANGSNGTGLDGGSGWGGPYNVNNAIKSLVRIEDRTANPVVYSQGEITIRGGNRALRLYDIANGSQAVQRPLGTVFLADAGESLWFSILFRTASASPLADQDFIQIGFDDNADASGGVPRVSIGANTTSATFPAEFQFFARSTTAIPASVFRSAPPIAAATTYLLVTRIQPTEGIYDTVTLFVNPSSPDDPGPPSASVNIPSGLATLSHAFIRTVGLDNGDAYVLDELHIGRDYATVVQSLRNALRIVASEIPGEQASVRWPVSLTGTVLETSTTLEPNSWTDVTGPFGLAGAHWQHPAPANPGVSRAFFRLRR